MKNKPDYGALGSKQSTPETREEKKKRQRAERTLRWYNKNKERVAAAAKVRNSDPIVKQRRKENYRRWAKENRDYINEQQRLHYEENPESKRRAAASWRQRNPEHSKKLWDQWHQNNPGRNRENSAAIRAMRRQACPPWCRRSDFISYYAEAQSLTISTGEKYEVDHIVPMRGKNVCGLHVPWNLRVVTFKENRAKHRTFDGRDGLHPTIANGLLRP